MYVHTVIYYILHMRKNGKIYNKIEEKTYISEAHALRGNRTPGGSSFPTRMATTQVTTTPLMRDGETRWAAARRSRYLLPECTAQCETRECLAAPVLRCRVVGEHAQPGRRPPRRVALSCSKFTRVFFALVHCTFPCAVYFGAGAPPRGPYLFVGE